MAKNFLVIIVLLALWVLPGQAFAIGMMTQPISIKDILRGQETFFTLTLLNSQDKEAVYGLKASGQIEKWVSFYEIEDKNLQNPITEIKMSTKGFKDLKIKFSIPNDARNGKYTGEILAFVASGGLVKPGETSVDVSQQVSRQVAITVTDKEIIDLESAVIPSDYGIKSGQPLKIKIEYFNKGNVAMKPDVQLTIKRNGSPVFNAIFPFPELEEPIRIKERKSMSYVEWSTSGQENGGYTAEVKILNNGKTIKESSFNFSIGYFKNDIWVSAFSFIAQGPFGLGWVVLGAVLLAIAALTGSLRKKRA